MAIVKVLNSLFFALGIRILEAVNYDPSVYRMVVTSNNVNILQQSNFDSKSSGAIIMKYDLGYDPNKKNQIEAWTTGNDVYGMIPWDYTQSIGPLGINGPLGPNGVLGTLSNLPNRFKGTIPSSSSKSYYNNWCDVPSTKSDASCVYGSYGPLGESGPLEPLYYYKTMYHLNENVYWYQDYSINLDSSGVWGIQGPIGPTGALGVLGALGPLGFSLQSGVTTTADGVYMIDKTTVRSTSQIRYDHGATTYRVYDLFELYSKSYAKSFTSTGSSTNDCSFGVDAIGSDPPSSGDIFYFNSAYNQFVHINVVPGKYSLDFSYSLQLDCTMGSSYITIAKADLNPSSGLMNFIVARLRQNEKCRVTVKKVNFGKTPSNGYYLYVTGSGLTTYVNGNKNSNPDVWGVRSQSDGTRAFNINGVHQSWIKF